MPSNGVDFAAFFALCRPESEIKRVALVREGDALCVSAFRLYECKLYRLTGRLVAESAKSGTNPHILYSKDKCF